MRFLINGFAFFWLDGRARIGLGVFSFCPFDGLLVFGRELSTA